MLTFLVQSRTTWNDYFTGTPTLIQKKDYTSRSTLSGTSVYVLSCLFRSITSTSSGGALYCTSVTYLLVEFSSFFSCKTSGSNGGAVYFSNSGGECVLHEVCGYDCCPSSTNSLRGQFSYIYVSSAASSKNYLNYSSIARCVDEKTSEGYVVNLGCGKICCPSVNSSLNKCYTRSGIYCYPNIDSNYVTCSLTYSTFADNNATGYTCVRLNKDGAKFEVEYCNILRNTQVNLGTGGTIDSNGNVMIEGSCILENTATYIFSQASSYTITLSNCTVDSTSNNGYLITRNTITKSFIHALNHVSTLNCHAEYDAVGTLTPITPPPSSSNKQIHYCTYVKFIYQSCDFFSLTNVFLLNFIHMDASSD
jgi:predicted outer membrane repeat protein